MMNVARWISYARSQLVVTDFGGIDENSYHDAGITGRCGSSLEGQRGLCDTTINTQYVTTSNILLH